MKNLHVFADITVYGAYLHCNMKATFHYFIPSLDFKYDLVMLYDIDKIEDEEIIEEDMMIFVNILN